MQEMRDSNLDKEHKDLKDKLDTIAEGEKKEKLRQQIKTIELK